MKGHATLMSKASDEWATPQEFFDVVNARLGPFTLDAAATPENAKARRYFTQADNALIQAWGPHEMVWLNPPYSQIAKFADKALEESRYSAIALLVPARTDTQWWHRLTAPAFVSLLKGRLRFGDSTGCAPFPSALVLLGLFVRTPNIVNWDWRHR